MGRIVTFYEQHELAGRVTDRNKAAVRIISDGLDALEKVKKNCHEAGIVYDAFYYMATGILSGNNEMLELSDKIFDGKNGNGTPIERDGEAIGPFIIGESGGQPFWRILRNNDGTINFSLWHHIPRLYYAITSLYKLQTALPNPADIEKKEGRIDSSVLSEPLTAGQTLTKDQEEKIYKKVSYEKQMGKKIFNNAKFNHFKEHLPILINHQFIKQEDDGRYSWIKGSRTLLAYYFSQLQRKNNPRVEGYVGRKKPVNLSWAPIQNVFRQKNLAQAYKESILADGKNGISNLWDNESKILDGIISGKITL